MKQTARLSAATLVLIVMANLSTGAQSRQEIAESQTRLSVSLPPGAESLVLEAFHGQEAISSLYSFQLDLVSGGSATVPMDAVLGKEIGVTFAFPGGQTRHFHGICSRMTQGDSDGVIRYRAEMVPKLWLLTRRQSSRIFQEMAVPDIVAVILRQIPGLDVESRLMGDFHPRNYVVQYRESDFDFVARLMEEEGIFYFFEHAAGGHKMVLGNSPAAHPDLPGGFQYRRARVQPERPDSILAWEKTQEIRSGKYTLWDHSFELPSQNLEASAGIQETAIAGQVTHRLDAGGGEALEIYDFPGEYAQRFDGVDAGGAERPGELQKILDDGQRTVGIRMQEEAANALLVQGRSTAAVFAPGRRFQLTRHVDGDGAYVLTSVQHSAHAALDGTDVNYENQFECIPASLPFRPRRMTPGPVIPGTQTAVVVGPPGQEIFTDKYGRVKVQFHWDRQGRRDANSSCWVRVGALYAGTEAGSAHVPEIGDEVVVAFLEGDPDQPIIVGSVYNADRLPPSPSAAR